MHKSVKELNRAGKTFHHVKRGADGSHSELKARREKQNHRVGLIFRQNKRAYVIIRCLEIVDNAAVIDVFSLFFFPPLVSLRCRRRETLKCFSSWCVNGWGGPSW